MPPGQLILTCQNILPWIYYIRMFNIVAFTEAATGHYLELVQFSLCLHIRFPLGSFLCCPIYNGIHARFRKQNDRNRTAGYAQGLLWLLGHVTCCKRKGTYSGIAKVLPFTMYQSAP